MIREGNDKPSPQEMDEFEKEKMKKSRPVGKK